MVEGLFHTLVSSSSVGPFHFLPPLKARPPNNDFTSLTYQRICPQSLKLGTAHHSEPSAVPTCERNLLRDWPQLLQISIESKNYMLAQAIHGFLVKSDCLDDIFVDNNLVNLYSKFSLIDHAQRIFDGMLVRNTITWTTLMKGYLENADFASVFRVARDMYRSGEKFNEYTCSVVLKACECPEYHIHGEKVHAFIIKNGIEGHAVTGTSLVSMYSRSGHLGHAEKVFNDIIVKDVQCINYMILEYGKAGLGNKGIRTFKDLLNSGLKPTDYTFTNTISSCESSTGLYEGKQLHGLALKYGFLGVTSPANAIITMYAQYGMIREAERMFHEIDERSLISWSALLSAFVKNGYAKEALDLFLDILEIGVNLDSGCFSTVLDGCSESNNLEVGLQIQGLAIKLGLASDMNTGTALIDLYAKCGSFQSARMIFDSLPGKTIASFNAILAGYLNSNVMDIEEDPMFFFSKLRFDGVRPDWITFSRLLSLSADRACLSTGKSLHAASTKMGLETDSSVCNAIITMYAKCGSIQDAHQIFSSMNGHDCVTWNAIISAYALHGEGKKALCLFEVMKEEGFAPDEITVLAVLQACSYSGLWESGLRLFIDMEPKYGIRPVIEHFACVVDLLGRARKLYKAMNIINKSPFPNSPLLWRTLVHACKLCGNLQLGTAASKKLLELAPNEASAYILVSNMYAGGGMPEEAAKVRTAMNDLKLIKETGSSWIQIDNKVHYFVASDKDHPEIREIYANLDLLRDEIKWRYENRNNLQLL
ncbi:hypothetical protein L6164_034109 [Bauhinia variegata]|uniref:Uncharacterized protein n=1 Tax=Bauhinia variegata TaxID=167791 RepID=A0ACB9KUN4_BAUVA|nr:hypothetical protein L6164_034109 [Bauhinia variegata]